MLWAHHNPVGGGGLGVSQIGDHTANSMETINIPYGTSFLPWQISTRRHVQVIESPNPEPIDPAKAIWDVLWHPTDHTTPLADRIRPCNQVAIVISDITRGWIPTSTILEQILKVLNWRGIKDHQITVIVAIGSHRPLTQSEIRNLVSPELARRLKVINHDCQNPEDLVAVGDSTRGTPIALNRHYIQADCRILTGGITYHFMSGFSGGRKSILPGIAAYETIQANHCMLLDAGASYGSGILDSNPLHHDMMEIAALAEPTFLVNAIPGARGDTVAIVGGDWDSAWQIGTKLVAKQYGATLETTADLVIASPGGYPLDINLYQSIKALINGAEAVKPDGGLILVAQCMDGTGASEFSLWLDYPDLETMETGLRTGFTVPGFIAYTMRQIAGHYPTALVSDLPSELVLKTGMVPHTSIQAAIDWLDNALPRKGSVHVLPQGNLTLPILAGG